MTPAPQIEAPPVRTVLAVLLTALTLIVTACGDGAVAGTPSAGVGSTAADDRSARAECPPQQDTAPTPAPQTTEVVGCFRLVDSYDDAVGDDDEDRPIEDFVIVFGTTRAWADGVCGPIEYRYSRAESFFGDHRAINLEPIGVTQCGVGGDGGDFPRGTLAVIRENDGGLTLTTGHLGWTFVAD